MKRSFSLASAFFVIGLNLLCAQLTGCVTATQYSAPLTPTPTPDPAKKPPPPEPPKPEFTICRVSNRAGRIFSVTHETAFIAESQARRKCAADSRNCVLLSCKPTLEAD